MKLGARSSELGARTPELLAKQKNPTQKGGVFMFDPLRGPRCDPRVVRLRNPRRHRTGPLDRCTRRGWTLRLRGPRSRDHSRCPWGQLDRVPIDQSYWYHLPRKGPTMATRLAYSISTNDRNTLAFARVLAAGRVQAERIKREASPFYCEVCKGDCREF